MPQASDTQRALMQEWFGDPVDDSGPMQFLLARGWTEDRGGMLYPPTPSYTMSIYEAECLMFLICEWDYDAVDDLYVRDSS